MIDLIQERVMISPFKAVSIGFTLAELLISLAILGVIATFTIPKVLQAQQDQSYNAKAKEAAATIAQAFQLAQRDGIINANTRPKDLTPYMNYVSVQTSGGIDGFYTYGTYGCSAAWPCIKFHNGAVLNATSYFFNGTSDLNMMSFVLDPDGVVTDGTTNGPGKSVQFDLYYNGYITTSALRKPNSICNAGTIQPCVGCDPPWFSW